MNAIHTATQADEPTIIQLIVFHIGDEEFGIPIWEVREIIKAGAVTPIPDSPSFIRGLINVRGEIVATVDLRARFSIPGRNPAEARHTVITKQRDNLFGLMVDEVTEVLRIPEAEIKRTPKLTSHVHDAYMTGVLPLDNRLIILLDLARVFAEEELTGRTSEPQSSPEPPQRCDAGAALPDFDSAPPGAAAATASAS